MWTEVLDQEELRVADIGSLPLGSQLSPVLGFFIRIFGFGCGGFVLIAIHECLWEMWRECVQMRMSLVFFIYCAYAMRGIIDQLRTSAIRLQVIPFRA